MNTVDDFAYLAVMTVAVNGHRLRGDGFVYVDSENDAAAKYYKFDDTEIDWFPQKFRDHVEATVNSQVTDYVIVSKNNTALHVFTISRSEAQRKVLTAPLIT